MTYLLMPALFMLGILAIALEEKIKINKAAIALLMALALWGSFAFGAADILGTHTNANFLEYLRQYPEMQLISKSQQYLSFIVDHAILTHIGDISQTLFFVMSTMIIIALIDSHGGFEAITLFISTRNKRKLLWIITLITFLLAPLINNMACAIIMVALLRKLIHSNTSDRMAFSSMVIIAANAGGAFSPIGDVTTILLWTGGNISALHQITHLFIPCVVTMLVPLFILSFSYKRGEIFDDKPCSPDLQKNMPQLKPGSRFAILIIGVSSLALVPVFRETTGLPPFMGVLFGLVILWIYTDILYSRIGHVEEHFKLKIPRMITLIDMPTILFFLGILMSVAALQSAGQLSDISRTIDQHVSNPLITSFILGTMSSFIDNVALVAGTMGMYDVVNNASATTEHLKFFISDGSFWTFIAYCAVTGGSLLIIGSATGVAVMGMENISFGYYLKRFAPLATIGYICGSLTYLILN